MAYNEAVNKRYTKQGQEDMTMKRYTEQELWAFVNRADTHEKIQIADKFLTKLDYLSVETYDAMMDALAGTAIAHGIRTVYGYYYPTAKNKMVKEFFDGTLGFEKVSEDDEGNITYSLDVSGGYEKKNRYIQVLGQ